MNTKIIKQTLGLLAAGIFCLLLISSCSDDDDGDMDPNMDDREDPTTVNLPPNDFELLEVADSSTNVGLMPVFKWEAAIDPDSTKVVYDFFLDTQTPPANVYADNLTENTFVVSEALMPMKDYFWKVVAKDSAEATTESTIFRFRTQENQSPNDFALISVADGSANVGLKPSFTWEAAIDPDSTAVVYSFFLDTQTPPTNVYAADLTENSYTVTEELAIMQDYFWKVVAKDSAGATTASEIFSFTTRANQPPGDFELISVADGSINVGLKPNFTWEESVDPDSTEVVYSFFLDTQTPPTNVYASDLTENAFTVTEELAVMQDYFWKVVAMDSEGAAIESTTFSFKTRENQPPSSFDLIDVADGSTSVDVRPIFTWEEAIDPDSTEVVYDFFLDTQNPPTHLYAAGLSQNSFTVTERLTMAQDYYWKVIARDDAGAATESQTNNFNTRDLRVSEGSPIESIPFAPRRRTASVVFNDKIWIVGGLPGGGSYLNDVWYSENGEDWILATASADFAARWDHSLVAFDDKLWLIGGHDGDDYLNDVWYSEDGTTWNSAGNASFAARGRHTSVVFDDKIFVIGGYDGGQFGDVWSSADGLAWTEVTSDADFTDRSLHTSVVFDNKIWVIAGIDGTRKNDVWYSADGATWTEASPGAQFSPRVRHASVVFDNKMWVIGGSNPGALNDFWHSSDGVNWTKATDVSPFADRRDHASLTFQEKIWVFAGYDIAYFSNIWAFD